MQRVQKLSIIQLRIAAFVTALFVVSGCSDAIDPLPEKYNYINPVYDEVALRVSGDTLHFRLDDRTYNDIKCFNRFVSDGKEYLSFFDKRSESINIYLLDNPALQKRILLKELLVGQRINNTTVYVRNFDSIYIANNFSLYRFNNRGQCMDSIRFKKTQFASRASLDNLAPPIFKDENIYVKARPYLKESSLKDLNKWRVVYSLNLAAGTSDLAFYLPKTYRENIYGMYFFDYSYCMNDRGNFVFSFPADAAIYETDLISFNDSYFGRSRYQTGAIRCWNKNRKANGDSLFLNYLTSNSYGGIFFDPFRKRYLRVAKSSLTMQDYWNKNWRKKQSIIIFDEHKKIIGETAVDDAITLTSIFFSSAGDLYVRTNYNDQEAIHFLKMTYAQRLSKLN